MMMERLLQTMAERKASDLFLSAGAPVTMKINGIAMPQSEQRLDAERVRTLLREIVSNEDWASFERDREFTAGYGLRDVGTFRIALFRQRGTPSAVIRFIPGAIPTPDELGIPPFLTSLIVEKRGLLLVVGASGSGKSTTLASLLQFRNAERSGHILTLEDPIEFTFRNQRSIVNQRQIGTDSASLENALNNAMRQAPDVIMIGEIRDPVTMSQAIAYAQSGHLVVSTMHANNAYHALTRIVSFYSPENRRVVLSDLAASLRAVVSQRLVRGLDGLRMPATEVLLNTTHISELIEHGRISEIKEAMEKSLSPGSMTFEQALLRLVIANRISRDEALLYADSATNLLWMMDNTPGMHTDQRTAPAASPLASASGDQAAVMRVSDLPGASTYGTPGAPATPGERRDVVPPSFSEFLLNI